LSTGIEAGATRIDSTNRLASQALANAVPFSTRYKIVESKLRKTTASAAMLVAESGRPVARRNRE